ncbi:DUF7824 domain-containing protein [Streptomyces alkaliphilus]|uniref:DUF7824 domain-containing protein n=1 Tax=Streptomyces alkaliphilus TaxID=1472722 RepID=UPI00117D8F1F|nr:DUF6493 family protein [Streptomyces alkaliphilus]MQS08214.1 hypothetical protein [Streptomyces alkaliphilus]
MSTTTAPDTRASRPEVRAADPKTLARLRRKAGGDPSAALLRAVEEAAEREIPTLLADLDDAARRALVPELKRLRRENRWGKPGVHRAAHLAGTGCHTGPVACATWLAASREFFRWGDTTPFREVLAGRSPEFLAKVVERFADRSGLQPWEVDLLLRLADAAGVEPPVTEGVVTGWSGRVHQAVYERVQRRRQARRARRARGTHRTDAPPADVGEAPAPGEPAGHLLTVLREDPLTARAVPVLLDTRELSGRLYDPHDPYGAAGPHPLDTWAGALAHLAGEGLFDREALIETAIAVSARSGHPLSDTRFHVALLRALDPTDAEAADRTGDWVRLLAEAPTPAAGYAQETLRRLWEAELLTVEQLAEMSRAAFFRGEKKLIRVQLSLLDAVMRARPETVPLLLPAVGEVFGHADTALRERALRVVGRRVRHADRAAREELVASADLLGAGLLPRAAELLDAPQLLTPPGEGPAEPLPDVLPEPRVPRPLPAPATGPEEFAAVAGSALAAELRGRVAVADHEWTLDGLVRLAHRDRAALVGALEPILERHREWLGYREWLRHSDFNLLLPMVAAADGLVSIDIGEARRMVGKACCRHAGFSASRRRRVLEVTEMLISGTPPLLLSTPDDESGALAPGTLLERLRLYRDAGVKAGPVDLDLALLRCRPADDPTGLAERARELGTPEGARFAGWVEGPGLPDFPSGRMTVHVWRGDTRPEAVRAPSPEVAAALPALPELGGGYPAPSPRASSAHWCGCGYSSPRQWASLLPHRPDAVAVHLVPSLANSARWNDRPDTGQLITLAEAPGPAGPALHLAIAYGLGARHTDDRLATVDAILALAGRGTLDTVRLGTDLAEVIGVGAVKVNRIADALTTLASAGAPATAWAVLSVVLPVLLAPGGTPPRGVADLLAAAAGSVEACGARGDHAWLDALADRKGGSRAVTEAGRLRRALAA